MEKQRQIKILSIVALVLAISAMTLGFAAFSTTLNISSSASVTPNSADFAVKFSTSQTSLVVNDVNPNTSGSNVLATKGKIVNGINPTLSNISVTFTSPGQYATYVVYARNEGEYTAYLNNINFLGEKFCIAEEETTESLVQSACDSITLSVLQGAGTYKETTSISNYPIEKNTGDMIVVRIMYAENGTPVDGPFNITFPSISLVYSTVDDSSMNGQVVRVVSGDINTVGSVVAIGNEQFYVYGKENENVKLLSMMNITLNDNPIQSSSSTTTAFSSDAQKGTNYSDYIGSIVESYVNSYKTYLTNIGADISLARLITKEELEKLGCSSSDYTCNNAPIWIYSTSYWSSSAYASSDIWYVDNFGTFIDGFYDNDMNIGVRPVIEIPISEFE